VFDRAIADFAELYAEQNRATTTRCVRPWTAAREGRPRHLTDRMGGPAEDANHFGL